VSLIINKILKKKFKADIKLIELLTGLDINNFDPKRPIPNDEVLKERFELRP